MMLSSHTKHVCEESIIFAETKFTDVTHDNIPVPARGKRRKAQETLSEVSALFEYLKPS